MRSQATWKVIAADLPIGVVSHDAVAQGDGPPLGREFEIADLLSFIKHAGVRNTVWLTADMHYTAAHYYDPNRAVFQDFEPFWEFVSGPAACRHLGVRRRSTTRSVRAAVYQKGCSAEQGENLAPCFGLQFFGHVAIDGATEVMTVTLKDVDDRDLWSTRIEPKLLRWSERSRRRGEFDCAAPRHLRPQHNCHDGRLGSRQPSPEDHAMRRLLCPDRHCYDLLVASAATPRPSIRSTAPRSWPARASTSRSSFRASPTPASSG